MNRHPCIMLLGALLASPTVAPAADLTVRLADADRITFVGAVRRWDQDGNPRRPVDPQARIDQPAVDAMARRANDGDWVFDALPVGRYDLVLLGADRLRIEGFGYPPVQEFDPFLDRAQRPADSARESVVGDIAASRYYENKVMPLYLAGNPQCVRVLVQLLRDQPTSFDAKLGEPAATLRHEIWQYTYRFGAWTKERRTRVLDRVLLAKRELRQWTWIWEPALGDILLEGRPRTVQYRHPSDLSPETSRGLWPY